MDPRHRAIVALLALPFVAILGATPSLAADKVVVVVSGGVMAATNPFLLPGTDTDGQSAFVEAAPEYSSRSELSTLTLRGRARFEQYFRRYSRDELYTADLDYSRKVSERVSLNIGGGFLSSRASSQAVLFGLSDATGSTVQNPVPTLDVSTFGLGDRVRVLSGRLGAAIALGPRDNASIDLGVADNHYSGSTLYSFLSANQNLRYSRKLSENTDLYLSVNVTEADYRSRREGDSLIVTPVVGLRRQLSRTLELSADVGASWASVADTFGTRTKSATVALHGQLCDNRERSQFCVRGSHAAQPTALGRVRKESRIDASYRLKMSENNQLQLNAAYGRTGESLTNLSLPPISLVNATAEFSHTIRRRLTLFASSGYGDLFQSGVARRANIQGRVGVRYFFGALQ